MSNVRVNRVKALGAAVRSAIETLESRVLLSAGAIDTTFGTAGSSANQHYDAMGNWTGNYSTDLLNPGYITLWDTTANRAGHYYDWESPVSADTVPDSIYGMTVDAGGKIVTVGTTLGRHLYSTPAKFVITNPEHPTQTETVQLYEDLDQDININRYYADGTPDDYSLQWPAYPVNNPGDRDFQSIKGTYPIPSTVSAEDYARSVATEPETLIAADGTVVPNPNAGCILIAGTTGGRGATGTQMMLARYYPVSGLVQELATMSAPTTLQFGSVNAMIIQPDGKIIVAGSMGTPQTGSDFTVWRFNADFTLDTTFIGADPRTGLPTQGYSQINFSHYSDDEAMGIALEPATITNAAGQSVPNPQAGQIVAVGYEDDSTWSGTGTVKMVVMRYNANGALDTTFGSGGKLVVNDFGGKNARGTAVAIQSDGRIVLVGAYDGQSGIDVGAQRGWWTDTDKGGYDSTVVVRLLSTGAIDQNTFGARGKAYITFANKSWIGQKIAFESTGKIIIGGITCTGAAPNGNNTYAAATRLSSDGRIDTSYGTNGFETVTSFGGDTAVDWYSAVSLAVQPSDDKVLLGVNIDTPFTLTGGIYGTGGSTYEPFDQTPLSIGATKSYVVRLLADNRIPKATLQTRDVTISDPSTNTFTFQVTYTDESAIDVLNSLGAPGSYATGTVTIRNPAGIALASNATITGYHLDGINSATQVGNSNIVTVTYTVDISSLTDGGHNGAYTIVFNGNTVRDTEPAPNTGYVPAQVLGQFSIQIIPSVTVPPTATLTSLPATHTGRNDGITVGGTSILDFTITYVAGTLGALTANVRYSTLGNTNILVTGPNFSQMATLTGVYLADGTTVANADAPTLVARYRITAPGGTWDVTDNGQYDISMQPYEVSDNGANIPNYIPAGVISPFNVSVDPSKSAAPQVVLWDHTNSQVITQAPAVTDGSGNSEDFWVYFKASPDTGIAVDRTTLAGAIRILFNGNTANGTLGYYGTASDSIESDNNGGYYVHYKYTNPTNWTGTNNGVYTITLVAGVVADTDVIPNRAGAKNLGTFNVSIDNGITASFVTPPVITAGSDDVYFTVRFNSISDINAATLNSVLTTAGGLSKLITLTVPSGVSFDGSLSVANVNISDLKNILVTYKLTAPTGGWNVLSNGTYSLNVNNTDADTVVNANGKKLIAGLVGTFTVNLSATMLVDGQLQITGTSGNDTILVTLSSGKIYVKRNGVTSSYVSTTVDSFLISGGDGNDKISVAANILKPATILGGNGNDTLCGGASNDSIKGGDGRDYIYGNGGNDTLCGDAGDDRIYGGAGDDSIYGGDGNDYADGGAGNDMLSGDAGNDTLLGNSGNDAIYGGIDSDYINGGTGNDMLYDNNDQFNDPNLAGHDNAPDTLIGGGGTDQAYYGSNDTVSRVTPILAASLIKTVNPLLK